jgi:hypothetical protein
MSDHSFFLQQLSKGLRILIQGRGKIQTENLSGSSWINLIETPFRISYSMPRKRKHLVRGFRDYTIFACAIFLFNMTTTSAQQTKKIAIYIPSTKPVSALQKMAKDALHQSEFEPFVYSRFEDFQEALHDSSVMAMVAPASFGRYNQNYAPILRLEDSGGSKKSLFLLAMNGGWDSKSISVGRLGIVEEVEHKNISDLVKSLTGSRFRIIRTVSRPVDLISLLALKSADLILLSTTDYTNLQSQMPSSIKIVSKFEGLGLSSLYVRTNDRQAMEQKLKALPNRLWTALGFQRSLAAMEPLHIAKAPPPKSQIRKLAIIRSPGPLFDEAARLIRAELATDKANFVEIILTEQTSFNQFQSEVKNALPDFLILMDNQAVEYAKRLNNSQSVLSNRFHGVALLALNLHSVLKDNSEIAGVAFETSPYLLMTRFRSLTALPSNEYLVFYRKSVFGPHIQSATVLLKSVGISLVSVDVEQSGDSPGRIAEFLAKNLPSRLADKRYAALWVMLDSQLLNQSLFNSIWQEARLLSKLPFIMQVDQYVSHKSQFATYAIFPKLKFLTRQVVQQIRMMAFDGVEPTKIGVEELIEVGETLNKGLAKELELNIDATKLEDIEVLN